MKLAEKEARELKRAKKSLERTTMPGYLAYLLYLCLCVPFLLISTVLLITRVGETKGIDLSVVTGSEWD